MSDKIGSRVGLPIAAFRTLLGQQTWTDNDFVDHHLSLTTWRFLVCGKFDDDEWSEYLGKLWAANYQLIADWCRRRYPDLPVPRDLREMQHHYAMRHPRDYSNVLPLPDYAAIRRGNPFAQRPCPLP